jgi:hypothetical protein
MATRPGPSLSSAESVRKPSADDGDRCSARSAEYLATPFEGAAEGDLVGVLEVAAHGET